MSEKNGLPRELATLLRAPEGARTDRAWAAFVERYSRILLHAVHAHAQSYDDAMDKYAYVLEELQKADFARLRKFAGDGRSRLSTWLVVVARRLCDDYRRLRYGRLRAGDGPQGKKARERHDLRRRLVDMVASDFDIDLVPDGEEPVGERALRSRELEAALKEAISELSSKDQLMIKLRFYEEMSLKELAAFTDSPSQFHVHRRLKGALDQIRRRLESSGVRDPRP
jgi:RNA polymerase sigma factor (sigma-70 family)